MSRYRQTMREALEQVYENTTMGYIVKFANSKGAKIAQAWYKDEKSAKEALEAIKKNGGNGIITKGKMNESDAYDNNRYMMKKYGGQILARPDNSNTKDGKDHVYAPNAQIAKQLYKQGKKVYREESDHEVSMARGELEAIADKASQLAGALQGKSDEGNPLEAWVQSKITKAKDYINSVSDYLMYNPDMKKKKETELEESISVKAYKNAIDPSKKGLQINKTGGMSGTIFIKDKKELKDLMTKLTQATKLYNIKEELEEGFSSSLKQKAKEIAKKFANNMTKAVDEIEKLAKGLSDEPEVYKVIRQYNEEIEVDEKISDIFKANKEGESIDNIAKRLKLSTSMVKKLIGEDLNEQDEQETDPDKIALAKEKDTDTLERQLKIAQGQINVLKQKIENEKNKAVKPLPNPETGEVPLTIGIAHKVLRDMKDKEEEEKKQKEASKQIQNMAKGGEETKLESFTKKYLSHLNESEASDKAKAMGLTYMSFGRYGKDGEVTHKSVGGSLKALSKKDQEKDSDVKPTKPKTKTTGSIKNKDGSNTTSGSIKKEILKKIEDEDLTDPEILANFDVEIG